MTEAGPFAGQEVSLTGRLASMSHDEAIERIERAGGTLAPRPTEATRWIVVGQYGPLIGDDGRLTEKLERVQELEQAGHRISILSEDAFLAALGLEPRDQLGRLYTTERLSRILGVPPAIIRGWVRHGLITPAKVVKRLCFFEFQQVSVARAVLRLTGNGVKPAVLRRSLSRLEAWVQDAERSLPQIEAQEEDGEIHLRLPDGNLAEPSGQLTMDFTAAALADESSTREAPVHSLEASRHSAEEWFQIGVAAEESGRLEEALEAYGVAAQLNGNHAEVHFNLGNILYAIDRLDDAIAEFERAIEIDADYVEAWNNLGNTQAEAGRLHRAIESFSRAIEIEPRYADAHYNLGETFAQDGDMTRARKHWRDYLRYDPNSDWARHVRQRLEDT